MPTIEFDQEPTYQNFIEISDLGQCAIEATTNDMMNLYMIINTSMGQTTIATCGPIIQDVDMLPNGFTTSLTRMDYNEAKISKAISLFLNNKKIKIIQAMEVEKEVALDNFKDLGAYIKGGGE